MTLSHLQPDLEYDKDVHHEEQGDEEVLGTVPAVGDGRHDVMMDFMHGRSMEMTM